MDAEVILKGFHRRAVLLLAFSPNGKYLASVGQDDDHSVAIWDWRAKTKVYSDKSDKVRPHSHLVLCVCVPAFALFGHAFM
jgi:WD40 repeat protein